MGVTTPAVAAAPARDVKRDGHNVAFVNELNVAPAFDHFAGDLVAQHHAFRCSRTSAHHVLIAATDIGCDDLENDAVLTLAITER